MNQILVVEDEPDMAVTYERVLRRAGHRVVMAATRAAGMRLLKRFHPRLVISDLRLPDGTGLDIIKAARNLDPPPPVIAITAFPLRDTRRSALDSGAQAFLVSPIDVVELSRLVEELIGRAASE